MRLNIHRYVYVISNLNLSNEGNETHLVVSKKKIDREANTQEFC